MLAPGSRTFHPVESKPTWATTMTPDAEDTISRLVLVVRFAADNRAELCATIVKRESHGEVLDEGLDETHSPLGVPVHWQIVRRGSQLIYRSMFNAPVEWVERAYGADARQIIRPGQRDVAVTIETEIPPENSSADPFRGIR